jgi:transposase InsO family protein
MTEENKSSVLRQVYYGENGFGSIAETYKEAKKILDSITYNDTKQWLEKQKSRQTKPYRGFNSYVAPNALHEFQIDLAVFTDSSKDNDGYKYLFLAIDVFSKYIVGVPIKDKKPAESIRAFKEVLDKMGTPFQIMTDREGAWESTEFVKLLNQHKIKHIISSSPPPFGERAVQEIKNMIHTRLDGLNMDKEKWIDALPTVLKKYNNRVHSTIGMTPAMARRDENRIEVYLNIRQKAQFKRNYEKLEVGDTVRTTVKKTYF